MIRYTDNNVKMNPLPNGVAAAFGSIGGVANGWGNLEICKWSNYSENACYCPDRRFSRRDDRSHAAARPETRPGTKSASPNHGQPIGIVWLV
jgi:hypothetical protein